MPANLIPPIAGVLRVGDKFGLRDICDSWAGGDDGDFRGRGEAMKLDLTGCSRTVLLTKRYAFKFPSLYNSLGRFGWREFLQGLLANMQEITFARTQWKELCPVLFYIPGGFLVVMPRVQILTDEEFLAINLNEFLDTGDYYVPAERKANSFGWLNGEIVAVDYGN